MVDFITLECNPAGELNFFHSGDYSRASFSTNWRTTNLPETDGLGSSPVYIQVLNKFGIPVDSTGGLPPGGFLPGIDIRNMPAIQAIRLSLAEALTVGQWWDIYEDAEGGVRFVNVFDDGSPGQTVSLDIRLCVPSATKENEVDMVIVRGYNKPPQRYAGEFKDVVPAGPGLVNPEELFGSEQLFTVDLSELIGTCINTQMRTESVKSYTDPMLDVVGQFGPQETNPFYQVKDFETLIDWVVDVSGMEEAPELAARVSYKFHDTTSWLQPINFPSFVRKDGELALTNCPADSVLGGEGVTFFEGEFTYISPEYTDRFGLNWPLIIKPAQIFYVGYKIDTIVDFNAANAPSIVFVNPIQELVGLSEGSQWTYTVEAPGQYKVKIFYQPKLDADTWETIISNISSEVPSIRLTDPRGATTLEAANNHAAFNPTALGIIGGPNSLGYLVTGMWMSLTVDRPSVIVSDPNGEARFYSDRLRVQYAPLILFDPPAPIAYKHKDFGSVIVDQSEGLRDSDPTTCQSFEETPLQLLQDRAVGNVIDVNLPFCQDEETCLRVAETMFDYHNHSGVQTYTLTCGPDDEPILGAAVAGFDTDLRIETINYSFQDSSSYTIEVTLGPIFSHVGSWNNGAWIPDTEEVTRKAIVVFTAGDGVNYRVRIQGLGEMNAINGAEMIWRIGEQVDVKIYNVPVNR